MNFIDKMVGAVSPIRGAKRMAARAAMEQLGKVVNYGYSEGGASYVKKSL